MKNVFHLLFLLFISCSTITAQVSIPSKSKWYIPVELAPNELQFFNPTYQEKGISQIRIQYYGQKDYLYYNSEGLKIKLETYSNDDLLKRSLFHYTFFKDRIQIQVSTIFFRNLDTTRVYQQNFTFIDSIAEYPSGHSRRPYQYVQYNLQGKYIKTVDKTPKDVKKNENKFAYKYSGGGHRVDSERIYSSKNVIVKELVKEYDYFIASTPEYFNEREYIVKFKYYKNGLLKSCNGYKLTYQYFTK